MQKPEKSLLLPGPSVVHLHKPKYAQKNKHSQKSNGYPLQGVQPAPGLSQESHQPHKPGVEPKIN